MMESFPRPLRHGACLEHGEAHAEDHATWSRRDFMGMMGLVAAGGSIGLGGTPVRAFARSPLLERLARLETDRVLVLIQLSGGNDGLNTVVPVRNDVYYAARPRLAIDPATTIPLDDDHGLHPAMSRLESVYGTGRMAVVQSVGYPDPNLSHFRATDIWLTASDADEVSATGWGGRLLDTVYPHADDMAIEHPLAVQIGATAPLLFQGLSSQLSMSVSSTEIFRRLVEEGELYTTSGLPDTAFGAELAFVRSVANDAFEYADAVEAAENDGTNRTEYPGGTLGTNLALVARLIKGRLGARIYHVSLGSFDTHANQLGVHAGLLGRLAEAVGAFSADLAADDADGDVLTMTFSEFGRRVAENGSNGTDHGTAAPLFLFGSGVAGGLYGSAPDLAGLEMGNLRHEVDFRSVYATVLGDWFGLDAGEVTRVLGRPFDSLDFISGTPVASESSPPTTTFGLGQNYPNPFSRTTSIPFSLRNPGRVRLQVYDLRGRLVRSLLDGWKAAGHHEVVFDAARLPSGTYLCRLETPRARDTRRIVLVQ